ncbi:MAG: O-antigen ligase family protein [Paracoccaceae bacterium]|nr:O-antigen ligase family protein [Paracoccaceae bacterium]
MAIAETFVRQGPTRATEKDRPRGRLHWTVLVYLVAVMVPIGLHIGPLKVTDIKLLMLFTTIPTTFRMLRGDYGGRLPSDILYVLYVAWAVISLLVNNPGQAVSLGGSTMLLFLGSYALARAHIRSIADFTALAKAVVLMVVLTLPLGILESITGVPIILRTIDNISVLNASTSIIDAGWRLGLHRVQVIFAHPIHYGLFCTIAFSLAFIGMEGIYNRSQRFALSALSAVCVFLSLSSGALLAILLQVLLIGWAAVFRNVRARWWLLTGLFVLAYVVVEVLSNRSAIKVFMSYATFSAGTAYWRLLIFQWGMFNVMQNPVFGIGLHDWIRPAFMHSDSVDNFWLLETMRYGVPAFVFLVSGYLAAIVGLGLRTFEEGSALWRMRRAWMFTFVGLTFTLITVDVWGTVYSFIPFMFGAGMWMMTADPEADPDGTVAAPAGRAPALSFRRDRPAPAKTPAAPVFARPAQGPTPQPKAQIFARTPPAPVLRARAHRPPERPKPPSLTRFRPTDDPS